MSRHSTEPTQPRKTIHPVKAQTSTYLPVTHTRTKPVQKPGGTSNNPEDSCGCYLMIDGKLTFKRAPVKYTKLNQKLLDHTAGTATDSVLSQEVRDKLCDDLCNRTQAQIDNPQQHTSQRDLTAAAVCTTVVVAGLFAAGYFALSHKRPSKKHASATLKR